MDDFYKQFRENLENRPEPAFEEKDWRGMERLLDQQGKRPWHLAWWWAIPFLLLLLGANAFVLLEQKRVARKLEEMTVTRDTVFHSRVIYVSDTIYRTEVIREKVAVGSTVPVNTSNFSSWWALSARAPRSLADFSPPSAGLYLPGYTQQYPPLAEQQDKGAEQHPGAGSGEKEDGLQNKPYLRSLLTPLPSSGLPAFIWGYEVPLSEMPLEPVLYRKRKTALQYLYPLRPKGLQLGLSGGGAFPFSQSLSRQAGGMAGLQLAVEFSPHIRMWADASYFRILLETAQMDESIGVPLIEPPSDDFIFSKAEVPQPTLQGSVGMQYLFATDGKWSPFAGLGYGSATLLPHDVIYEFKNPATEEEWNFDSRIPGSSWYNGFVIFQAGVEYELSRSWNGQLRASYRANWNNLSPLYPRILDLRAGLLYRF